MISDCSSIFEKFRLRSNIFSAILNAGSKSKLLPLERSGV